jgi:hypothetical protein
MSNSGNLHTAPQKLRKVFERIGREASGKTGCVRITCRSAADEE